MQHIDARWGGRSDADEVPDPDLLHEQPEGTDVGAMEGRLDAPSDRSPVQPRTHVCPRDPGSDRRLPTFATHPIREGVDAGRARRDLTLIGGWLVIAWIASKLGRAPSTISRELGRNGGQEGYRATQADDAAWDRALRSKPCKPVENQALARIVSDKLRRL